MVGKTAELKVVQKAVKMVENLVEKKVDLWDTKMVG